MAMSIRGLLIITEDFNTTAVEWSMEPQLPEEEKFSIVIETATYSGKQSRSNQLQKTGMCGYHST